MENLIRLSIALTVFSIMILWEYFSPRRQQSYQRKQRWPINLGLATLNMVVMRLSIGSMAYLSAIHASDNGWGLLNLVEIPYWLKLAFTLLALDMAIYFQHVLSHKWRFLWRFHQVHHTDLEFDATTAVRFHPLEIIISMLYKVIWIYLLGADPLAVITFEVILNATATFNHSNINISDRTDKILRWLVITPDTHRIHHSTVRTETDSNYGFSISLWDRLFKTYLATPIKSQTTLDIGLPEYREARKLTFLQLLQLPFFSPLTENNKNQSK